MLELCAEHISVHFSAPDFPERVFGSEGRVAVVATASRGFVREIASLGEIFDFLGEQLSDLPDNERLIIQVNLVVEELFTNLVRHNVGGGDQITINLDRTGNNLQLELIDDDVEHFDPAGVEDPHVEAGIDDRKAGGLGIHLVTTMVDELNYDYEPENRRMRIKVSKALE